MNINDILEYNFLEDAWLTREFEPQSELTLYLTNEEKIVTLCYPTPKEFMILWNKSKKSLTIPTTSQKSYLHIVKKHVCGFTIVPYLNK